MLVNNATTVIYIMPFENLHVDEKHFLLFRRCGENIFGNFDD